MAEHLDIMDSDRQTTQGGADGETLRAFLNRGPIVAFIKDQRGRFVYINPAMEQQLGVPASHFGARNDAAWMPEHLAGVIREHDPQLLEAGPVEMIAAVPRDDGSAQYWKIVRFPFAAPGGS